jgi:hypothetical protein
MLAILSLPRVEPAIAPPFLAELLIRRSFQIEQGI